MGPRWKGKGSEAQALAKPMSKIFSQLQSSLTQSEAQALLSGSNVLLVADSQQADVLNRTCFGIPMTTSDKDKQWFQLGMEEAFYLSHSLKCLNIINKDKCLMNDQELWQYMKSNKPTFPDFYKAYSHLRAKNWVVMSGVRYGVDFVAYRHHPALVHSELAVLVLSKGDGCANERLRVWSDIHCATRLCSGVVKTLLVLEINKNGHVASSPSCVAEYSVSEYTIARWVPERGRENDNHNMVRSESSSNCTTSETEDENK